MDMPACPDCGAPMNVNESREIGREIRKDELWLSYTGRPEEYAKLPEVLGRKVGPWVREEECSRCPYQAVGGVVKRRGKAS